MFSNQVTLKSGGYIVINQTEALVAIDVNSGRSTREHNIEDTALRTNLEAADEIARQLRLRDLAGSSSSTSSTWRKARNNRAVERRLKDALKNDRARIQVGRISHFGLLEMSRQRIRTGVLEGSTVVCPHCQGAGVVRSTASIALHVLRVLEDALIKSSTHDIDVRTRTPVALYILNQKRAHLRDLERRFGVAIVVAADDTLTGANYHALERGELATGVKAESDAPRMPAESIETIVEEPAPFEEEDEEDLETLSEDDSAAEDVSAAREREGAATPEEAEVARRRRRRRRRRGGERSFGDSPAQDAPQPTDDGLAVVAEIGGDLEVPTSDSDSQRSGEERNRRPRRSRGGRDRFSPREDRAPRQASGPTPIKSPNTPPGGQSAPEPELDFGSRSLLSFEPDASAEALEPIATLTPEHVTVGPEPTTNREASAEAGRAEKASQPAPETSPAADEPPRPRRTGWWQRARASVMGD